MIGKVELLSTDYANPLFIKDSGEIRTKSHLMEVRKFQARESSKVFERNMQVTAQRRLKPQIHSASTSFSLEPHALQNPRQEKSFDLQIPPAAPLHAKFGIHSHQLPKFTDNLQIFSKQFKISSIKPCEIYVNPLKTHKKLSKSLHELPTWSILNDSADIVEKKDFKIHADNQFINYKLRSTFGSSSYFDTLKSKAEKKAKDQLKIKINKAMLIKNRIYCKLKGKKIENSMVRTSGFVNRIKIEPNKIN